MIKATLLQMMNSHLIALPHKGQVERNEKEGRGHKREEQEGSTEFGKRKAAGNGRRRNKAGETRAEQDGRNRWQEKEKMKAAWGI